MGYIVNRFKIDFYRFKLSFIGCRAAAVSYWKIQPVEILWDTHRSRMHNLFVKVYGVTLFHQQAVICQIRFYLPQSFGLDTN